jgi:hypothetical protein
MQNQKSSSVVLPLAASNRVAGDYTSGSYAKAEMSRVAFQIDFTAGSADGTTAALQIQGSIDETLWHNIGAVANITLSATVRGAIVEAPTAAPSVRLVATTAVNASNFSVIAIGSM